MSTVIVTEVAGGMQARKTRHVTRLLASLDVFPVTAHVAWKAAELMRSYRRSHSGIRLGDYLIAATAATEGLQLATLNLRHFPMFADLKAPFELPSTSR